MSRIVETGHETEKKREEEEGEGMALVSDPASAPAPLAVVVDDEDEEEVVSSAAGVMEGKLTLNSPLSFNSCAVIREEEKCVLR